MNQLTHCSYRKITDRIEKHESLFIISAVLITSAERKTWLCCLVQDKYLIIDFPGQVELYTHNNAVKNIVGRLVKEADLRLVAVHMVDSHYCADPSKFLSVCLTSLTTMLQVSSAQWISLLAHFC